MASEPKDAAAKDLDRAIRNQRVNWRGCQQGEALSAGRASCRLTLRYAQRERARRHFSSGTRTHADGRQRFRLISPVFAPGQFALRQARSALAPVLPRRRDAFSRAGAASSLTGDGVDVADSSVERVPGAARN